MEDKTPIATILAAYVLEDSEEDESPGSTRTCWTKDWVGRREQEGFYVKLLVELRAVENCGALPYMSEVIGYNGPIYMTHPTKAIVPILWEELRRLNIQNSGKDNFCSTQGMKNCMKKVTAVDLHKSVMVDNELEIKAYYAGHVLGAAMFLIKVGSQTVVYTGDFNMNPDRHLGAAWIDKCQPDLLITQSIYADVNPNKKRYHKDDFLKTVEECMSKGGKVLIPVFIVGRAQELCILLDAYWEKMNFSYPIYFATESFTERVNSFYSVFAKWTNQKTHKSNNGKNVFEFKHIKSFSKSFIDKPEPMVILATNGMLQHGLSMHIFKKWAHDENNVLILPDFCSKGTLGGTVAAGAKEVEFANKEIIKVKLKVEQMCFDTVADAKGTMQLIEACDPKSIIIMPYAKTDRLMSLQNEIIDKFKIECFIATLGEQCSIKTPLKIPSDKVLLPLQAKMFSELCDIKLPHPHKREGFSKNWILVMKGQRILLLSLYDGKKEVCDSFQNYKFNSKIIFEATENETSIIATLFSILKKKLVGWSVKLEKDNTIIVESVQINVSDTTENIDSKQKIISISWKNDDEDIGLYILYMLQHMN